MRSSQLSLFSFIVCSLVKSNEPKEISNPFLTSEQEAIQEKIPAAQKLRILDNLDFNPEDDDANSRDESQKFDTTSDQEPGQNKFSSRLKREENQTNYSECGLDMDSLRFESSRVWPWMVALRYTDDHRIVCGATIINERFIMTSVSCVTDSTGRAKNPDEINLTLGLADGKGGDEAEDLGVRSIHIHPRFSRVNYDYDVALLELEEPITYNRYKRPICLPPTEIPVNSNLYKPLSVGLGLGWGSESIRPWAETRQGNTLKEADLIIQHPDACKESLRTEKMKAYFTDRMFCAAEKGPYLCMGDSGGPAMQSQVRDDGYRLWTQVGIISWGVGCGPNSNGFYSHVHKLLPWILSVAE